MNPITVFEFKEKHSHEARLKESSFIMGSYPSCAPILVFVSAPLAAHLEDKQQQRLHRTPFKFIFPMQQTVGLLLLAIRKELGHKLLATEALFSFVGSEAQLMPVSQLICDVYDRCRDNDQFLYVTVAIESTYGHPSNI